MATLEEIRDRLVELCLEHGLLSPGQERGSLGLDLIESGVVDSMGVATLQAIVEENFHVAIPAPLFVAELRSLNAVAAYLQRALRTRVP